MCVCILMMCSKIGVLFLLFFGLPWACANCDVQSLKCLIFFFFFLKCGQKLCLMFFCGILFVLLF